MPRETKWAPVLSESCRCLELFYAWDCPLSTAHSVNTIYHVLQKPESRAVACMVGLYLLSLPSELHMASATKSVLPQTEPLCGLNGFATCNV